MVEEGDKFIPSIDQKSLRRKQKRYPKIIEF